MLLSECSSIGETAMKRNSCSRSMNAGMASPEASISKRLTTRVESSCGSALVAVGREIEVK